MVFSFSIPTTSHLPFQVYLTSSTHPSLPAHAATARHALRVALKNQKTLPSHQRAANLQNILTAINEYIPYLFAISQGLDADPAPGAGGDDIEIDLERDIKVEWRATLSEPVSTLHMMHHGGRDQRVKGFGIEFEIAFVLTTMGYILSWIARTKILSTLYSNTTPSAELKTAAAQVAMKHLLLASSVHTFLASSGLMTVESGNAQGLPVTPDLDPSMQSALASLAMAEATLLAVLKDDAYLSACIQSRNKYDTDWMIKPPDIPKVRALLFARLCVRAAEYAEQAAASAGAVKSGKSSKDRAGIDRRKTNEDLINYMRFLARVARAKACRFFAIDAEIAGKVGEGIAWLRAGKAILGLKASLEGDDKGSGSKSKEKLGFSQLRRQWSERKEEKRLEETSSKTGEQILEWGDDAGREEEGRVIDMLEAKWMKINDTINTQAIPSSTSFLSNLPSGRDIHSPPGPYVPPSLDADQLARMRAPLEDLDPADTVESSEEEAERTGSGRRAGYF